MNPVQENYSWLPATLSKALWISGTLTVGHWDVHSSHFLQFRCCFAAWENPQNDCGPRPLGLPRHLCCCELWGALLRRTGISLNERRRESQWNWHSFPLFSPPLPSLPPTENDTPAANRAGKSVSNAISTLLPSFLRQRQRLTTCHFVDCGWFWRPGRALHSMDNDGSGGQDRQTSALGCVSSWCSFPLLGRAYLRIASDSSLTFERFPGNLTLFLSISVRWRILHHVNHRGTLITWWPRGRLPYISPGGSCNASRARTSNYPSILRNLEVLEHVINT